MRTEDDKIKTHCSLGIKSYNISADSITKELDITPSKFYNKGDKVVSKNGGIKERAFSMWMFESRPIMSTEVVIAPHLEFFKNQFFLKIILLEKYKNDPDLEVSFYINIKTEDFGAGLDLHNADLQFFYQICNRVTIFFNSQQRISDV